jgi:hypothetical protein
VQNWGTEAEDRQRRTTYNCFQSHVPESFNIFQGYFHCSTFFGVTSAQVDSASKWDLIA